MVPFRFKRMIAGSLVDPSAFTRALIVAIVCHAPVYTLMYTPADTKSRDNAETTQQEQHKPTCSTSHPQHQQTTAFQALGASASRRCWIGPIGIAAEAPRDRKSTRLNSSH